MCEQTEINYLDGDVVWVKLRSYWWPGQVVGLEKLPEDVQTEFQKKPLIAAVKFFQEDAFEFVKNYQQIYKYNCTKKDDFIRKGLDKYRSKSKDGSNYMDKFPEDVKRAETLTDGDPDILLSKKFSPEEKPDATGLFGQKKTPKKKRSRDDVQRRSDDMKRKVTHTRFFRENDNEVRHRQHFQNQPSTSTVGYSGEIFPCYLCGYTATRVNVIISHLKHHRLNNDSPAPVKSKPKANAEMKLKYTSSDSPKRKYVRKAVPNKSKNESSSEPRKRKYSKQFDKPSKKKKSDPELREKLLADWNEDSDDDNLDVEKSVDSSVESSSILQSTMESVDDNDVSKDDVIKDTTDNTDILQESSKLLEETDSFAKLSMLRDVSSNIEKSDIDEIDADKQASIVSPKRNRDSFHFKKSTLEKSASKEKDDKTSRLSCFDFDEDDVPEPSISSVRKIPRGLGSKNMSIKKEIIKEFEMSQALKNSTERDLKNNEVSKHHLKASAQIPFDDKVQITKDDNKDNKVISKEEKLLNEYSTQGNVKKFDKIIEECETQVEIVEILEVEKEETNDIEKNEDMKEIDSSNFRSKIEIRKDDRTKTNLKDEKNSKLEALQEDMESNNTNKSEINQVQNFDIFEKEVKEKIKYELEENALELNETFELKINDSKEAASIEKDSNNLDSVSSTELKDKSSTFHKQETILDVSELKDKTVTSHQTTLEAQHSDVESSSNFKSSPLVVSKEENKNTLLESNLNSTVKKRRGRPRKSLPSAEDVASDSEPFKFDEISKNKDIVESERKTSESDSDRSYSGRRRNPNRKYQTSLYMQSFDHRSSKTDESLSESDDKPVQTKTKLKRGRKSSSNKSRDSLENLKSPSNHTDDGSSVETDTTENIKSDSDVKEFLREHDTSKDTLKQSNYNNVKEQKVVSEPEGLTDSRHNNEVEILPPKKSQIKKFELSQMDTIESEIHINLNVNVTNDNVPQVVNEIKSDVKTNLSDALTDIKNEVSVKMPEAVQVATTLVEKSDVNNGLENFKDNSSNVIIEHKSSPLKTSVTIEKSKHLEVDEIEKQKSSSMSSPVTKILKESIDKNQFDSFQERIIKTLQNESSSEIESSGIVDKNIEIINDVKSVSVEQNITDQKAPDPVISNFSITDNFDSIEVVVTDNVGEEAKPTEDVSFTSDVNVTQALDSSTGTQPSNTSAILESPIVKPNDSVKKDESLTLTSSPSTPEIKVSVPVKKREKPRIIENVTLKEPMILKTKLMEKHASKIGKHKIDNDNLKINEIKDFHRTKVMKMETVISNSKNKSHVISGNQSLSTGKKPIKALKTEDGTTISSIRDSRKDQVITALPQTISDVPCSEKYIQQSSQSLVDMDLDINSMPFVLSEDVLTPESIEQMPVVISSVLPTSTPITTFSTTIPTTVITPAKQGISANQSFDSSNEIIEVSPKKKSGTPTILKTKGKAKPTITSIKTIVPPLSSTAIKAGYKVNTQALKTSLANQKTSGKYVIVQTSGHQQAYSTHQKVAVPTTKGSGNAQIIQQGGKVVILTSPQAGQSSQKMLHLNPKAVSSGKVQRIVTTKQGQQVYSAVSPQNLIGNKTVLTPKGGDSSSSPTTSKISGQKILGQQVISSKSVLSQIPGTITKPAIFGNLPQGILTKEGIFTPINAATLGGKTIISSKTLLSKGFPAQGISTKNLLTPITQSIGGKTIISSQGIVSKGTVLTPITGSQVKALAAKNSKTNKIQYQTVQRKVSLAGVQKSSKVPVSASPTRTATNVKTSSNMIVLQNNEVKSVTPNKKGIKQVIPKQTLTKTVLSPTTVTTVSRKIASRQSINPLQKVIRETTEESVQLKPQINNETTLQTKIIEQKRVDIPSIVPSKSTKTTSRSLQKKVSATIASSPTVTTSTTSLTTAIPHVQTTVSHEKIPKKEEISEQVIPKEEPTASSSQVVAVSEAEKVEETKPPAQTQIMAWPTENSDGSHTYVLVTVDEQGHIIPLDNNALMSLDGAANLDGSRTLYIDSSSLGESGSMENIVLQIDNGSLSSLQTTAVSEPAQAVITETLPTSEITPNTNQDILAAALANTDFQHEIGVSETTGSSTAMTSLTQTSLINQTILQSTIIPPTEPISSPLVLETSLTLNQPIMTPLEVPSNLPIHSEMTPVTSTTTIPTSIEIPITASNQNISYITTEDTAQNSSNSMPEIQEAMETVSIDNKTVSIEIPIAAESTVEENLKNITNEIAESEPKSVDQVSYSISISENEFDKKPIIQTTPSMPIIDDAFNASSGFDPTNASVIVEDNLRNFVTKTSEELIQDLTGNDSLPENNDYSESVSNEKSCAAFQEVPSEGPQIIMSDTQDACVSSQHTVAPVVEQSKEEISTDNINKEILVVGEEVIEEPCTVSSEASTEVQSSHDVQALDITDQPTQPFCDTIETESTQVVPEEQVSLPHEGESSVVDCQSEIPSDVPSDEIKSSEVVIEEVKDEESVEDQANVCQTSELTSQDVPNQAGTDECKTEEFKDSITETSQEVPSQSYEQLVSATSDSAEVPSQSAKSESSREAVQSLSYEPMETDDNGVDGEPPTQSYDDSKQNEASQSYKSVSEINANAPTQSFNEMMDISEERGSAENSMDDPNFPTQSYEVEKLDNPEEHMETDTEISQEGNIPSQSNDIGVDGIGTSSVSTNNSGLNEDETASSSYVPETPENQERDQDQESAISTSSYEIPPCEELNIASSSVIPDTSVQSEHSSIHNNGVPEIPTSSYNLNPDSSSAHVDAVPTSSYEDQVVVEQNVSTSYQVPLGNLEETGSQGYVSSADRNEPTSYYPHHQEVSESYYERMCKQSNSRLEGNSEEEATPSYYETNPADAEASQSYFNQEEATPSYSNHDISPSYYDPRAEAEASQSYYSSHELNRTSQSALQNVEATQSFYQDNADRLSQQGEATPAYADRYSLDYVPVSSPLDRHDLVESSVPARSMDR